MKLFIFFVISLIITSGSLKAEDLFTLYGRVQEAWKQKDYATVLALSEELLARAPGHSGVQFQYARALAANNKTQKALKVLGSVARMGGSPPARDDEAFSKIRDDPEFQSALTSFDKNKTASGRSTVAFSFPGKDLIPEGIAYDPVEKNFYIGSTYRRKILKVTPDGKASDFVAEKEHGLWGMIGMEVDPARRHLWANTANSGPRTPMIDPEPDTEGKTAIFKFDLGSRKLIRKYETGTKENSRFLNDMAIAPNGDVYITESHVGEVYRITAKKDELELFVPASGMEFPNGIAISPDGRWLYVAHFAGITVVDVSSGAKQLLTGPADSQLGGHDGLVYYRNSLVGIQVLTGGVDRIVRFHLKNPQQVERIDILQINHPLFALPTTGDIAGDEFYYIANSQLRSFDEKGVIFPAEKLKDPVILKIELNH
jgi:sugar lactone lactonase YvrE